MHSKDLQNVDSFVYFCVIVTQFCPACESRHAMMRQHAVSELLTLPSHHSRHSYTSANLYTYSTVSQASEMIGQVITTSSRLTHILIIKCLNI